MRKILMIGLLMSLFAPGLNAQSIQPIAPEQCVWHTGDNPTWAAPDFDDNPWAPYTHWKPDPSHPSLWIRCRADLSGLRTLSSPAILVGTSSAAEVFVNGRRIGGVGNLRTGFFDSPYVDVWPLSRALTTSFATIAVHVFYRQEIEWGQLELKVGTRTELLALRDGQTLASARSAAPMAVCFIVVGVIGFALLGLFLGDRSRLDILVLGLDCVALCVIRLSDFASSVGNSIPISLFWIRVPNDVAQVVAYAAPVFLPFLFVKRRIPAAFWFTTAALSVWFLLLLAADLAPAGPALHTTAILFSSPVVRTGTTLGIALQSAAAWVAFRPWSRLSRNIQWIAALWLVQFATDSLWLGVEAVSGIAGRSHLSFHWHFLLANLRAITLVAVVIALLTLLLLDQRRIAGERTLLAGEMQAARTIQAILAPVALESIPGLRIGAAFHPMQEVGGDFYLCRALLDGRQRILLGDVSGKGTAAAMTATLLIGAAEDREADRPSVLLQHLNLVLCSSRVGGFATCLCADITAGGTITFANAGHLAPWRNGQEVSMPGSLPLGIALAAEYAETTFRLAPGDQVTLLSDGVVEAQSRSGELFGFDRTRAISTQSSEAIAQAAQAFGQQDDITVLTLAFAPAEVAHA